MRGRECKGESERIVSRSARDAPTCKIGHFCSDVNVLVSTMFEGTVVDMDNGNL